VLLRRQDQSGPGADYYAWLRRPRGPTDYEQRRASVRRYAFGVPNDAALDAVAARAPILELGAGTGYWAYLLRQRGVDIVAYDHAPPDVAPNVHRFEPHTWTAVLRGGVSVVSEHAGRALMLCWPGYGEPFADEALGVYGGSTLIYIGEGPGGHTADDAFFARLAREWSEEERVALPRWPGTHDSLWIYQRR
jgi:hypothetical protein